MKLDIIIVTYNSKKWLETCVNSIENSQGIDLKDIYLHFIDNVSKDGTIEFLETLKKKSKLGKFDIINTGKNLGFGKANNLGAKLSSSNYLFFLNPDTELEKDTLKNLFYEIENSKNDVAVWELKQRPYEHPKFYDPLTWETSWVSGAACVIRKNVFEKIGGFDKNIFMYAEDVDISWNVRMNGYKLKYLPNVSLYHYCYKSAGEIKPTQYYYSIINNLNLRLKYGNYRKVARWYSDFFKILKNKGPFKGSRKGLIKRYFSNLKYVFYYSSWKHKKQNKKLIKNFKPNFFGFDYEMSRFGAFIDNSSNLEEEPLVSIIVRTCGRPNVLRECLFSIKNQTYKNIEVVIVEDGKNLSEEMIKEEFSDLKIKYFATQGKVGRCLVGNKALEMSTGKYCNFLDDDDLFFPDHVETLVRALVQNKRYKAAYAVSFESKIEVIKKEPTYIYKQYSILPAHVREFSRITLLTRNTFPIQCVMFERSLFEKYGGFDEQLDNLEDWELWSRYAMQNTFLYVEKATSIYRVPNKNNEYKKRQEEIDYYYEMARKKIFKNEIIISPEDLTKEVEVAKND